MAGRQRREFLQDAVITKEDAGNDQDRTDALLRKTCEGGFEIATRSGIHKNELQAQRACRRLQGYGALVARMSGGDTGEASSRAATCGAAVPDFAARRRGGFETRPYKRGAPLMRASAAKLAAVPAGASPADIGVQSMS